MKFVDKINSARCARRGAIALEALLSIIILLVMTSVTWGICILIFNFSIISTSTQLASQAALMTYDRATYRGVPDANALQRGREVAFKVFRENSCGTVRGQFTGEGRPDSGCRELVNQSSDSRFAIAFQCRPEGDDSSTTAGSWIDCTGVNDPTAATMLKARATANIAIPFSFLLETGRSNQSRQANIAAEAFSFANVGQFKVGP